jgi:uncharacterized membrane protein
MRKSTTTVRSSLNYYNLCGAAAYILLISGCATQQVSYQNDVVPILESRCIKCHASPDGVGYRATGLEMSTYESLMQGTAYGQVIVAGDSRRSMLNMLVEGRAGKQQRMPHDEKNALEPEQIETLQRWVNQGALNN